VSAPRIFSRFKELLDVSWGSIADGNVLKRSGTNIVGATIDAGPQGPPGPQGVAQIWRGEYNPVAAYQSNDAVSYQGSSFVATQATTGVAPIPPASPVLPPLANTVDRGSIAALPASNQANYYARGDNTWQILPQTTYVVGPASSVAGDLATYADTTGRQLAAVSMLSKMPVGSIIQTRYTEYTANENLTVIIPTDNTIPQWTEGTEIMAPTITPIFSNSKILVSFMGHVGTSVPTWAMAALFRDLEVNAVVTNQTYLSVNGGGANLCFTFSDSPGTTSLKTYRIRIGPGGAATLRMNGYSSQPAFGGTMRTTLTLQEIRQ
jgi:hypothetical protein